MLERLKKLLGEDSTSQSVLILYGSETGNAEYMSGV